MKTLLKKFSIQTNNQKISYKHESSDLKPIEPSNDNIYIYSNHKTP
jgi:hypothetical protein